MAPSVVSTSPASSATGIPIASTVTATFSVAMDPATLNAGTFTLSGGVTGTVSYANLVATFTPSASLANGASYTATIITGAKSATGTPLASNYSWSFATVAAPLGQITFPLSIGKKWLYDDTTRGTACVGFTGCSTTIFSGLSVLVVDSQLTLQGLSATRLRQFRVANDGQFEVNTLYLAQPASGLAKYSTGASAWRTVLSTQLTSFSNGAFLLAGGPVHSAPNTLSSEQVVVPAGTYSAVSSRHSFTQTGQFAPADIFETERESFADGVGLLFATQSYSYDDNDPMGTDLSAFTRFALRAVDTFTLPVLTTEIEPNDTGTVLLSVLADSVIVSGNILMSDPAAIVGAVNPDKQNLKRVQDWYRFVAPRSGTLVIRLVTERYDDDLDLYVLQVGTRGYTIIGSSTQPAGRAEAITVQVFAGTTYYVAVQAWDTASGGRTNYWVYLR